MTFKTGDLEKVQQLVLDIIKVERNHSIPGTNRRENVIEHTFSVTMLCWRIYEIVRPPLDMSKIFKYVLIHDFSERGYKVDVNTYASKEEKDLKKKQEAAEVKKLSTEFGNFEDFVHILNNYEKIADDEALFVWSVDKMQGIILGGIDKWRPYASYGVTYKQFCDKGDEFLARCSPYVKDIFIKLMDDSCKTYYDNPNINKA
jgi:5'-deoxynucleotidase YfbR-like HD superfamily hydrolase